MHEFEATTQNFGPAIIGLSAAMRAGRLRHNGDPALTGRIGSVVGKTDRRDIGIRPNLGRIRRLTRQLRS